MTLLYPNWLLIGGPYGPSDCAGCGNRSLIMRSCREDGILLRADKPATMLDSAFTSLPFDGPVCEGPGSVWSDLTCEAINVWATHSEIGGQRYGYVLGLDLKAVYQVTPADILPAARLSSDARQEYRVWEYWGGIVAGSDTVTTVCDEAHPFPLPAAGVNANAAVIVSSYFIMAPVLPNGWTYLGEPGKLVAASARRVLSIDGSGSDSLTVCVALSEGETMTAFARSPDAKVYEASCSGSSSEAVPGQQQSQWTDADVLMSISCGGGKCECKAGCGE